MKNAIVTGASIGIGRAVAVELGRHGFRSFLFARRKRKLLETKKLVNEAGGQAETCIVDLSDLESLKKTIDSIRNQIENLDFIVYAADAWHLDGKHYFETELKDIPDELIDKSLDVGLKSAILITKWMSDKLSLGAKVVGMSGAFAPKEIGCLPQYVTKKGMEMFIKQLSLEFKEKKVYTHAISPWYVWTEPYKNFFPL